MSDSPSHACRGGREQADSGSNCDKLRSSRAKKEKERKTKVEAKSKSYGVMCVLTEHNGELPIDHRLTL